MDEGKKAEGNMTTFAGGAAPARQEQVEMTYDEAMALKARGGEGRRQVLTPQGWVRVDQDG